MNNNRLIKMNQYGTFLYVGEGKKGTYRNLGDYAEDLNPQIIEKIMRKLYYFEEYLECLMKDLNRDTKCGGNS